MQVPAFQAAMHLLQNHSFLGNLPQNHRMRSIHKGKTPLQILEYYPHVIPQPDSEEARQARVAQRFRLDFLGPVDSKLAALGKNSLGPAKQARARALLVDAEAAKSLLLEPQNAFLVEGHARHVETVLTDLRSVIATFAP